MSNKFVTLVAITASLAFATVASAQSSATATATATAEIVAPITITNVTDLDFGTLVSEAGTAVVAADAAGTYSGTATQLGTTTSASFDVTGHAGATFSVVTDPNTVSLIGPGAATMSAVLDRACASGTCTFDGLGEDTVFVGGTLTITASQAAGVYTSEPFDVTVAYN